MWVYKGSKFYNRSMKLCLEDNYVKVYPAQHNKGKLTVAERNIKFWKNKIYKYLTSILKSVYIDKSDDIINEYTL